MMKIEMTARLRAGITVGSIDASLTSITALCSAFKFDSSELLVASKKGELFIEDEGELIQCFLEQHGGGTSGRPIKTGWADGEPVHEIRLSVKGLSNKTKERIVSDSFYIFF